jgi:hypothetical protein
MALPNAKSSVVLVSPLLGLELRLTELLLAKRRLNQFSTRLRLRLTQLFLTVAVLDGDQALSTRSLERAMKRSLVTLRLRILRFAALRETLRFPKTSRLRRRRQGPDWSPFTTREMASPMYSAPTRNSYGVDKLV